MESHTIKSSRISEFEVSHRNLQFMANYVKRRQSQLLLKSGTKFIVLKLNGINTVNSRNTYYHNRIIISGIIGIIDSQ